jgi:hypothetical protein
MFKKLASLFLFSFSLIAADSMKISQYPRATSVENNDLLLLAYYGGSSYTTNKSITWNNIFLQLASSFPAKPIGFSILKGDGIGGFSSAVSSVDYAPATSGTAILKGNGLGGFSNAASSVDYAPITSGSSILKGNGSGGFNNASAGTDYQGVITTGTGITNINNVLSNNIVAGANVTITAGSSGQLSIAASAAGGGNTLVNGTIISNPNFLDGSTATFTATATTNITVNPTNIANAQISASAAIARSKVAAGTANHVIINDGSGNLSSEARLGAARFPQLTGDVTTSGGTLVTSVANVDLGTATVAGTLQKVNGGFGADNSNGYSVSGTNGTLKGNFAVNGITSTNAITVPNGGTGVATLTGLVKGNGTSAFSAASSGTDYAPATSGSAILKGNGSGGFSSAVSATDYAPATSGSSILKGNGAGGFSNAAAGTDYQAAFTTGLGITNIANVLSNNIVAGANVTITAGSNGQLSIASSGGGGGGGTVGSMINTSTTATGNVPYASDTTGTNFTTSTAINYASSLLSITNAPAANTAPTGGVEVRNDTVASSGNQQYSPGVFWQGQGWKTTATAASQPVRFRSYAVPVQGSSAPTANWTLDSSINGGSFGNGLTYSSAGILTAASSLVSSGGNISATVGSVTAANFVQTVANFQFSGGTVIKQTSDGKLYATENAGTKIATFQGNAEISSKTANYTVVALDSGKWFNNTGAAGTVTFTLPTAAAGQIFWFYNDAAQTINLTSVGSDVFQWGSYTSGTTKTFATATKGHSCMIYCPKATVWVIQYASEGWTLDSLARRGNATLVGGTVTVSNATVTANTIVMLTRKTSGGTIGTAVTYTLSAGTSFTINSDNVLDTSTFSWNLQEVP